MNFVLLLLRRKLEKSIDSMTLSAVKSASEPKIAPRTRETNYCVKEKELLSLNVTMAKVTPPKSNPSLIHSIPARSNKLSENEVNCPKFYCMFANSFARAKLRLSLSAYQCSAIQFVVPSELKHYSQQ